MSMTVTGVKEMKAAIKRIAERHPKQVKKILRSIAERIMTRSKAQFVPVDTGALKNTGHVVEDPKRIAVELVYGGPAAPYAYDQHENTHYHHTVGGPKYLERPLMEEVPKIAQEIARKAPYKP